MLKGFKDFIMKGNIVELAVSIAIGTAFVALIAIFGTAIINPLLAAAGGKGAAQGLGFHIIAGNDKTFINIGALINGIIIFVITAAVIYFLIVLPYNKFQERRKAKGGEPEDPTDSELLTEIRDLLKAQSKN